MAVFEGLAFVGGSLPAMIVAGVIAAGMSFGYAISLDRIRSAVARGAAQADYRLVLSLLYLLMCPPILFVGFEHGREAQSFGAAALIAANIPILWLGAWRSGAR